MSINNRKQVTAESESTTGDLAVNLLRIGELAKETGVAVSALRYYEEINLVSPSLKSESKYRYYNPSDVILVKFIKKSQNLGFSLEEITEILAERHKGKSPCPKVRKIAEHKIAELKDKIKELKNLEKAINEYIVECSTELDSNPKDQSVCHMIDKVKL